MAFQRQHSRGFVGVVFLAVALIALVIGAISTMSRSLAADVKGESAKLTASRMMKIGADINMAVDVTQVSGINIDDITLTADPIYGLFNSEDKYAVRPYLHQGQSISLAKVSLIGPTVTLGSSYPDNYVVITGVSDDVCRQINKMAWDSTGPIDVSSATNKDLFTPASYGFSTPETFEPHSEMCFATQDLSNGTTVNVYLRMLKEN